MSYFEFLQSFGHNHDHDQKDEKACKQYRQYTPRFFIGALAVLPSCLMMFLLFSTEKGRVSYIIHTETINTNPKGSKSGNNGYFQACVDLRRIVGAS